MSAEKDLDERIRKKEKWQKFLIQYGTLIDFLFAFLSSLTVLFAYLFVLNEPYCFVGAPRSFLCLVYRLLVFIVPFSTIFSFFIWIYLETRFLNKSYDLKHDKEGS